MCHLTVHERKILVKSSNSFDIKFGDLHNTANEHNIATVNKAGASAYIYSLLHTEEIANLQTMH